MDKVWLDVVMATGLTGKFQPFTEIVCDPPEPTPSQPGEWQLWAAGQLAVVAEYEAWQPGHYAFTAARRDGEDRPVEVFIQGQWDLPA